MKQIIYIVFILALGFKSQAQLTINNTSFSPAALVQNNLLGANIVVSNIKFNGFPANTVNPQVGYFSAPGTNLGLNNGIIISTGDAQVAIGPNFTASASFGVGGTTPDPDLGILSQSTQQFDNGILEFDFIPNGDSF